MAPAALAIILVLTAGIGGVLPQWYLPAYAALFVLAGVALLRRERLRRLDLAVLPILLLPLAQLLLRTSVDRGAAETAFLHLAAAAAVFWIALGASGERDALWRALAITGAVLAAEAMVQLFLTPTDVLGIHPITSAVPMGTFVDRDDFACCMNLLLPFALWMSVSSMPGGARRRNWRGLWWGLAAALMLGALVLSASRGGAIVGALELAAFAGWRLSQRRNRSLALALMLVLMLGAIGYTAGFNTLMARFGNEGVTDWGRADFIRSSLAMGAQRPVLGYGLGSWPQVYPRFARFDDGKLANFAHSEYAQLWAEGGAAGLAAAFVLLAAVGGALASGLGRSSFGSASLAPAAIALGGYALHATLEFVTHIPALLLLAAFIAGTALAAPTGPRTRSIRTTS